MRRGTSQPNNSIPSSEIVISNSPNNNAASALTLITTFAPDNINKHKCYEVLSPRRRAARLRADRIALLANIINLSVKTNIPPSILEDE